ncbi:hypothetical protein VUR80DRAFT_4973 [Thermomyces stellatus]
MEGRHNFVGITMGEALTIELSELGNYLAFSSNPRIIGQTSVTTSNLVPKDQLCGIRTTNQQGKPKPFRKLVLSPSEGRFPPGTGRLRAPVG